MGAKRRVKETDLTPAQEHFAREVVRLGSQSLAYRRAYRVRPSTKPETVWQAASHLAADAKVAARIQALKEKAAEKAVVTRTSMLVEMEQNREFAFALDNPSAAASASRDRAKVAGLMVDRTEHTGKDGAAILVESEVTLDDRNANDLARRVAFLLAQGLTIKKVGG